VPRTRKLDAAHRRYDDRNILHPRIVWLITPVPTTRQFMAKRHPGKITPHTVLAKCPALERQPSRQSRFLPMPSNDWPLPT